MRDLEPFRVILGKSEARTHPCKYQMTSYKLSKLKLSLFLNFLLISINLSQLPFRSELVELVETSFSRICHDITVAIIQIQYQTRTAMFCDFSYR